MRNHCSWSGVVADSHTSYINQAGPVGKFREIIDPSFKAKLEAFSYQKDAFVATRDLEYAAIFHEQGLGKTKIAIDLMLYWLRNSLVDTILLVVKKSLIANWEAELEVHSELTPNILTSNPNKNYHVINSPSRVILGHYEAIKKEAERIRLLCEARRMGIVLDESQKIKNPNAALTKSFHKLAAGFCRRIILTGTPIANRPFDIWSQIWFLDQGQSLGQDFGEFREKVDLSSDLAHDTSRKLEFESSLDEIFPKISKFAVRETKNSGQINLPDKVIHRVEADWEPGQADIYRQVRDDLRLIVVKSGVPQEDDAESILKRLLRLVQAASDTQLITDDYSALPGKMEVLNSLVDQILDRGEKCIVWTTFNDTAKRIVDELSRCRPRMVRGRMAIDDRNRSIKAFKEDSDVRVLVATTGAAKEGLTLTVANNVIFYDRSFSLDDYLQAQDRIHRISQERTCNVYNIILKDSIDEWVNLLLDAK